jgi:glycosyltransferase involved in cell wall biosynthesis
MHHPSPDSPPRVGALIRFSNSAATLPAVLEALARQTCPPARILGIDNHSSDGSARLIRNAGGDTVPWHRPYSHPATLNFGIERLPTELVLVLSSHTVLEDPQAIGKMAAAMADPRAACVSAKWDDDPFYSDRIDWAELSRKGLKLGSIYSNSMGMLRRQRWLASKFDESLPTAEDYAWAVAQLRAGHLCRRIRLAFQHRRPATDRSADFARVAFQIARRHRLRVAWLGPHGAIREAARAFLGGDLARSLRHLRLFGCWCGHLARSARSLPTRRRVAACGAIGASQNPTPTNRTACPP